MRTTVATCSLIVGLALAGVAAPLGVDGGLRLSTARASDPAVAVGALLSDPRGAAELSDVELSQRLQTIEAALQQDILAEDNRAALLQRLGEDRAELERRTAAAAPAPAAEEPAAAAAEAPPPEPAAEPAPVVAAEPMPEPAAEPAPADPAPADPVIAAEPAPAEPVQEPAPPPKKKRKQVAEDPPADAPQAAAPEPAPADPIAEAPAPPPAAGPELDEALAILNDPRPLAELPADELKARLKRARSLARNKALPDDVRAGLDAVVQDSRKALLALEAGQGAPEAPPKVALPDQPPAPAEAPVAEQPAAPADAPAATADAPPAPADAPATAAEAPPPPAKDAPPPAAAADIAAPPPDLAAKPKVVVEDEKEAAAVIADTVAPAKLDNDALKDRLEAQRELLEDGTISVEKSKVLRSKLKTDREALRARIATEQQEEYTKAQAQAAAAGEPPPVALAAPLIVAPTAAEVPKILRDERDASALDEVQLNRRIRAFRQVVRQPATPRAAAAGEANGRQVRAPLDPRQLAYIEELEQDRAELRRRLIADKRQRRTVLREETETRFEINIDLSPPRKSASKRRPPPVVWAAEAEDDEIERYLIARPIRRMPQQYVAPRRTVMQRPEAYVTRPEVRELLPSVEIDTVSFGFNESFVREEEVNNLDRIALVMERILAKHPEEVFLIEGHTDAVGSDGYNLRLSKLRAEAIKRALTDYYVIPPTALTTVGLGERYLKIWTPDPEQENRRVTLRRISAVMSEYDSGGAEPY